MNTRKISSLVLASVLTLSLTSCSVFSGDDAADTDSSSDTSSSSAAADKQASADAEADTDSAAVAATPMSEATPADLPVIDSGLLGTDYETELPIYLNSVEVTGGLTVVTFSVEVPYDANADTWWPHNSFSTGETLPVSDPEEKMTGEAESGQTIYSTNGVVMIDTVNNQSYHAAYDLDYHCLCSTGFDYSWDPGTTHTLFTSFAALPEDVDTVTVSIPGAPAFTEVPVTRN